MRSLTTAPPDPVREYLQGFSHLYPGIGDWYARIRPEFGTGSRSLITLVDNGRIQGVAITRNGLRAKLCHISITETERAHGLGRLLLHAAAEELVAQGARRVHVTTGEEVAELHAQFFQRYGFSVVDEQRNRYRTGRSELVWIASAQKLLQSTSFGPIVAQSCEEIAAANMGALFEKARFGNAFRGTSGWFFRSHPTFEGEIGQSGSTRCSSSRPLAWWAAFEAEQKPSRCFGLARVVRNHTNGCREIERLPSVVFKR